MEKSQNPLEEKVDMLERLCLSLRNEITRLQYLLDLQVDIFKEITNKFNLDKKWLEEEETSMADVQQDAE